MLEKNNPNRAFTKRETEVLQLINAGNTNRKMAAQLNIDELTVKKHRENAMRKLQAHNVVQLLANARAKGII